MTTSQQRTKGYVMSSKPERRRDPVKPEPVAKRGKQQAKKYHNRSEREMFQLGNRADLKEQ